MSIYNRGDINALVERCFLKNGGNIDNFFFLLKGSMMVKVKPENRKFSPQCHPNMNYLNKRVKS